MHPVETYLSNIRDIYHSGGATRETSFYSALEGLLNAVGNELKPRVRAVSQLADRGAGHPDFGLFTAGQFKHKGDDKPLEGALPERGVIEVKGWDEDAFVTAASPQVSTYWKKYGLVLVTNYRDFRLIGRDDDGKPIGLETFRLADSAQAFLTLLAHPKKAAADIGDRLVDFLRRALQQEAPLTEPEALAWFLASYAREARARVERAAELPALDGLRTALEEALGMKFEGERGHHFFRATLVQTLFYGIFSSWVLWAREHSGKRERFDWHAAGWTLHVPMVKSLFDQIATPTKLKPLGIAEVLDWTGTTLNRVDRDAFFQKFEEENAVIYFYEPFLKAYDPQLRKDLGVWYTPKEIVQYQVERVDCVLREELGVADGLADDSVIVLDPCCGTGAYLVETLKRIHRTLIEKGSNALTVQRLKKAASERVFGFEILPAPFVVSHLQIGLMLRLLGAPFAPDSEERAGVYLTNALTGWEPPKDPKNNLPLFPELKEERDKANAVKRDAPILVILGNPPYNAYAGTSPEEEGGLVDEYKQGLTTPISKGGWGIKKFNLDDLYVRFFRIAERRIVKTGKGVVSYISNFSYLGDPSFVVMRQRLLDEFDTIWVDCMNGDSRETGKVTPDGAPDPSVFSTAQTAVGIRVGTAICVMARSRKRQKKPRVLFQHHWGVTKRDDLLASLALKQLDRKYAKAEPDKQNRFSFRPALGNKAYDSWPNVTALCAVSPTNGLMEKRGGALIDIDRTAIEKRMAAYFNRSLSWDTYSRMGLGLEVDYAGMIPVDVRKRAQAAESFDHGRVVRYSLRPFDNVYAYYCPVPGVWNRARPTYWAQCWDGNSFYVTRPTGVASPEGVPVFSTPVLGDNDFQRGHSYYFPIRLRLDSSKAKQPPGMDDIFSKSDVSHAAKANLSPTARAYMAKLGIANPDKDAETAGIIWMHALAIGYSPAYLTENADGIRQDWPRIPLPAKKATLLKSAELGRRVAALLDTETPVKGVTCGTIEPLLKMLAAPCCVDQKQLDPARGDLDMTAGWGHGRKDGVCMPGKGRLDSHKTKDKAQIKAFGDLTHDVYMNDVAYWANVPDAVWRYYIGGYQVVKKWLSYREKTMLDRGLKLEEVDYVQEMVRRIAALILLQSELDANYERVKADTWAWPTAS